MDGGAPIVLVGLPGAGKTTVGRRLAGLMQRRFHDLDGAIAADAGRSIAEIFAVEGEPAFRAREAEATRAIAGLTEPAVVSAGGGWMLNPAARRQLAAATTIWLNVDPLEAACRLADDDGTRPLLAGSRRPDRLLALWAERLPGYRQATYTVETTYAEPAAIAEQILELLEHGEKEIPGHP